MELLRQVSPNKRVSKKKKKSRRVQATALEAPEDGGHMASAVMALLSSQAGDIVQTHKHLDASRIKEIKDDKLTIQKKTIYERLFGKSEGFIRLDARDHLILSLMDNNYRNHLGLPALNRKAEYS